MLNMGFVIVTSPASALLLLKDSTLPSSEWKHQRNMDAELHRETSWREKSMRNETDTNLMSVSPCDFFPQHVTFLKGFSFVEVSFVCTIER